MQLPSDVSSEPAAVPPMLDREPASFTTATVVASRNDARPASAAATRELDQALTGIRPQIYRFVLARLLDPHLADDVTQEVLMTLLATRTRCDEAGSSMVGWAFGIAARKISETHRTMRRRHESVIDDIPDRPNAHPLDNPEAVVVQLDAAHQLARLLAALPGQQGDIVRLRVAAGLSADETAAALGLTPGAVRVAQHRALVRLREMLNPDYASSSGEVTS